MLIDLMQFCPKMGSGIMNFTDYITGKNLYEVFIRGTVFDVGGRANSKTITVPLNTSPSYIGLPPNLTVLFKREGYLLSVLSM